RNPCSHGPRLKPNPIHWKAKFVEEKQELPARSRPSPLSRSCPAHPQRKRSRVPKRRRFRHSVPRLSSISDAWGRLNVVTPFHHLSGDSHLHRSLGAGPITASSTTLADFSRARDSQITFSVTHGWSAFWRGRPWLAGRRIGETSSDVGSSRFWIGWVTKHGDKCARSTCRD